MNLCGIIAEYNPMHLGHVYHIEETKKKTNCDGIVCILSGNFVQRGLPSILDKWTRAKIAIESGVDLVIELPSVFAVSSAEHFAFGGVSLLNNLNVIDYISFGSEEGNLLLIDKISDLLIDEPLEYKNLLKENLNSGLSYPVARMDAIKTFLNLSTDEISILNQSNNILSLEYLKAIKTLDSKIKPTTIKRLGANYNSTEVSSSFPSASGVRAFLKDGGDINSLSDKLPTSTILETNKNLDNLVFPFDMFPYIKYKLLTNKESISNIYDVSEGIDNKILKEIINANSLEELLMNIKSKRYAYTRLSRILCKLFIGLENYDVQSIVKKPVEYARILGLNSTGAEIIKEIKKKSDIEIITKFPRKYSNPSLEIDLLATKAYSMINKNINPMDDYKKGPYVSSQFTMRNSQLR